MAIEIERKFLLNNTDFLEDYKSVSIKQGYITRTEGITLRVRIKGDCGYITIKGGMTGISRSEFEYAIPVEDAESMLNEFCKNHYIEKERYDISLNGHVWEVDVFHGDRRTTSRL